jgi:hypothetical protein
MAQVPQDQRARVVGRAGDGRHVREEPGAVRHVTEDDQGRALSQHRRDVRRPHAGGVRRAEVPDRQAELGRDAVHDEPVRREVPPVDDHLVSARAGAEPGPDQLVEQHGRRIGDDHLAGSGPEGDLGQPVPHGQRLGHPGLIPASDQPPPPRSGHEVREPLSRHRQRPSERVAVQVGRDGRIVGRHEPGAEPGERVGGVQPAGRLDAHRGPPVSRRTAQEGTA